MHDPAIHSTKTKTIPAAKTGPATRLAAYTTNMLVSAVIVVLGITIGKNAIYWWRPDLTRAESARAAAERFVGLETDREGAHEIRFGEAPLLFRRRTFQGTAEELLELLQSEIIELAGKAVPAADRWVGEERMITSISGKQPFRSLPGQWSAYLEPLPLPMVLVVSAAREPIGQHDQSTVHVLSWGMALPRGEEAELSSSWTIIGCCPYADGPSSASQPTITCDERPALDVPLPKAARRDMALGNPNGAALVIFRGPGEIQDWKTHFSRWFEQQGWAAVSVWHDLRRGTHGRFADKSGRAAEIEIVWEAGQLRGLLSTIPDSEPIDENAALKTIWGR